MKSPNKLKQIAVAVPAAIALGLGASACGSAEEMTSEGLTQQEVISGPVGALRDVALDILVPTYLQDSDDVETIKGTRSEAEAIDHPTIKRYANDRVDANIADLVTSYSRNGGIHSSSYRDDEEIIQENSEMTGLYESIVDLIVNEDTKKLADDYLDYAEAEKAIEAGGGAITVNLLEYVENEDIKSLARKVLEEGDETAKQELEEQAKAIKGLIDDFKSSTYTKLYDGSNQQAQSINEEI
jgi:hypothetical protein